MSVLLAALLLAAAPEPVPVDLATLEEHALELDGKWVEFEAYVFVVGYNGRQPVLSAVPGETLVQPSGGTVTGCSNVEEAIFAALPRDGLLGPLGQRHARPLESLTGVRIRAIFRNGPFMLRAHGTELEWGGYFDRAVIESVTGRRCLLHPPEGALPLPPSGS